MGDDGRVHLRRYSSSEESIDVPMATSQSSATFSPDLPVSLPILRLHGPIPSIEGLESNPTVSTSSSDYEDALNTLEGMSLDPTNNESQLVLRGTQEKELSSFTFRGLHNTTPEPMARVAKAAEVNPNNRSGYRLGTGRRIFASIRGAKKPIIPKVSVGTVAPQPTKLRASSAPVQPQIPNNPPRLATYNIRDEIPPDRPYFNEDFQRALKAGKSIAQNIHDIFSACELARDRDSQVVSIVQTANELSRFDAPVMCRIGIVGDSGVGKSSLINSLLDELDLANVAGLGAACTSVITEYHLRKQGQSAKYTIEIERMADTEIEEQLHELLRSYRSFHLWDLDKMDCSSDEEIHLEKKSKLAWDTLTSAFGARWGLTETYLRDPSHGAEEKIQQQLKLWTNSLQWPEDLHQTTWLGSAETVEEYKTKMGQFLKGTLWPFIKIIRVFLSSQVLKSGAILADLPGFHDSNNARVQAAENYMYDCEEIFVVADITRAATNQNVEITLTKALGRNLKDGRPSQGVALVCTKSENLDFDEIRRDFFTKSQSEAATEVKLQEKILYDAKMNDQREGALRQRNDAQDKLDYLYMTARNDYIMELVQSTYAEKLQPRSLSVFCVSNKAYKRKHQEPRVHDLAIKGSGIPLLRKHCHKIPSGAQFRLGHHFLTVSLKGLVQQVQLWLAGGSEETMPNNAAAQRVLDSLHSDLKMNASKAVHATGEVQRSHVRDIMIQPMGNNLSVWTREAKEILQTSWENYHSTQMARRCASYGSWGSPRITYTEWNLEIIQPMVNTMLSWWDIYAKTSVADARDLEGTILDLMDDTISKVKDIKGASVFAESLVTKKESIRYVFDTAKELARYRLNLIKRDASQNHQTAYIFEELRPVYHECMKDSVKTQGGGVTDRRRERLLEAIGSPQNPILFRALQLSLRSNLILLPSIMTDIFENEIGDILAEIGSNIKMLQGTEVQTLAKNSEFLERLGRLVTVVLKQMKSIEERAAQAKGKAEADGHW